MNSCFIDYHVFLYVSRNFLIAGFQATARLAIFKSTSWPDLVQGISRPVFCRFFFLSPTRRRIKKTAFRINWTLFAPIVLGIIYRYRTVLVPTPLEYYISENYCSHTFLEPTVIYFTRSRNIVFWIWYCAFFARRQHASNHQFHRQVYQYVLYQLSNIHYLIGAGLWPKQQEKNEISSKNKSFNTFFTHRKLRKQKEHSNSLVISKKKRHGTWDIFYSGECSVLFSRYYRYDASTNCYYLPATVCAYRVLVKPENKTFPRTRKLEKTENK